MKNKKAIIIGCGAAGPTLAIALHRIGIDSKVYEASKSPQHFGILSLTSNCIKILKMLDVYDQLHADDSAKIIFHKQNGKNIALVDFGNEIKKLNGDGAIIVQREELIEKLVEKATSNGTIVEFGKKLVDIIESENKITAIFEDGTKEEGDFLIGCDGLRSNTRSIVFPNAPSPSYTDMVLVGGDIAKSANHSLDTNAFHMIMGKQVYFGCSVLSDRRVTWWTYIPDKKGSLKKEFKTITDKDWTEKILELHKDDYGVILDFIKASDEKYIKILLYDIPHLPTWHKNSICLIGDAAHATLPHIGQGASMAIEDAAVLAKCIRDIPNLNDAFEKFEKLRKKRVEKVVKTARQNGKVLSVTNPIQKIFRGVMLSLMLKRMSISPMNWIFSYNVEWDKKIK